MADTLISGSTLREEKPREWENVQVGSVVHFWENPNTPTLPKRWVKCDGSKINDPLSPFDGKNAPDLRPTTSTLMNNLIWYYKLDETSGSKVYCSHTGRTSYLNNTTFASGKINGCIYHTENNRSSIDFGMSGQGTGTRSFSFWIKLPNPSNTPILLIYRKEDCFLALEAYNKRLQLYLEDYNPSSWTELSTDQILSPNTWHHIVITLKEEDRIRLYVDGALKESDSSVTARLKMMSSRALTFYEFWYTYPEHSPVEYWGTGYFDEFIVWKREITPTEVTQLYNNGDGKEYPFTELEYNSILRIR